VTDEVKVLVTVTIDVGTKVLVTVMVDVVVDCVVMVLLVTPLQAHAETYRDVPEHAEAYVGTAVGYLKPGQDDTAPRSTKLG
jgi:hypothetical protein